MNKPNELTGADLDMSVAMTGEWKTAHCYFPTMTLDPTFSGARVVDLEDGRHCLLMPNNPMRQDPQEFNPSTNWALGGPLIEREQIRLSVNDDGEWWAERRVFSDGKQAFTTSFDKAFIGRGPTPLIAAMRCLVASKVSA